MSQAQLLTPSAPSFPPLTYQNIPVLTTEMLAQAYEVEPHQIRQNFKNNRARFVEGKHFFLLSGNELKEFKNCVENFYSVQIGKRTASFILWTDRGCARHAKSLNTDRAWDMYELLEETFFSVVKPEALTTSSSPELPPSLRSELKSLVDAKLSAFPARIQGKARSEIWTRFNRNFKIAEYAQLPAERMAEARDYLIEMEVKALKALSPALPKALPAPKRERPPLLSLTPEELAALDKAAQRVEELNRHVMKEISDLHGDILDCLDLRRMPFSAWHFLGAYIYSSLRSAAVLPSRCLEQENNPALAVKMLAGALDER